jgi:hypothetical protein
MSLSNGQGRFPEEYVFSIMDSLVSKEKAVFPFKTLSSGQIFREFHFSLLSAQSRDVSMYFATLLPAILSNRKSRVRLRLIGETLKRNGICRRIEEKE